MHEAILRRVISHISPLKMNPHRVGISLQDAYAYVLSGSPRRLNDGTLG